MTFGMRNRLRLRRFCVLMLVRYKPGSISLLQPSGFQFFATLAYPARKS
jgi:hypothetical protein